MKITKFRVNGEEAPVAESALEGQLLPHPSSEDIGKTVVVDENGEYTLGQAGGSSTELDSAIQNNGIGYTTLRVLIENAKSPSMEDPYVTVQPAVIDLVPGQKYEFHVSIPEYNIDEDVVGTAIRNDREVAVPIEKIDYETQQGYAIAIANSYDDQDVLTGNVFACIYYENLSTEDGHLPEFSVSTQTKHMISSDMVDGKFMPDEGQLLPEPDDYYDVGKIPVVTDGLVYQLKDFGKGSFIVQGTIDSPSSDTGTITSSTNVNTIYGEYVTSDKAVYLQFSLGFRTVRIPLVSCLLTSQYELKFCGVTSIDMTTGSITVYLVEAKQSIGKSLNATYKKIVINSSQTNT